MKTAKRIISLIFHHQTWWVGGLIIIIIGVGGYIVFRPQPVKYTYITQPVQRGTLINNVLGTGNLIYTQSLAVNSQVNGTISSINVHQGQTVKAGQVLFNVKNNSLTAIADKLYASYLQDKQAISNDETSIIQDQYNLNNATANLTADQQPTATPSQQQSIGLARQQQEVAKQQLNTAQLTLAADQANEQADWQTYLTQLETISKTNIKAPINGIIANINISPNQYISGSSGNASSVNNPEILIVNPSSLKASITLNEVDAVKVKTGQNVTLSFNALPNLSLTGIVSSINPVGNITQGVVTYNLIVTPSILNPQLKSGMSLTANITTEKINNVISVPSTAIKSNHTGEYVQILVNGKPIKVNVKTGLITNNGTEITSGLKSGEKVITQIISNKPSKSLNSLQSSGNLLKLNGGSGGRGGAKVRAGKL